MNLIEKLGARFGPQDSHRHQSASPDVDSLTTALYNEMLGVMSELSQLRIEHYDLPYILESLIRPITAYLADPNPAPVKPLFVSGEPGIGKTTLLMILDEALYRIGLSDRGSCRAVITSGELTGYFADKDACHVAPLSLFGTPTAVLNARDWNNLLRCWTFDEGTARESAAALTDFANHLAGKVVIVDEAEIEGYVYFTEVLAQRGILVILTSNLSFDHICLTADTFASITLHGPDHREGDIAEVCLPDAPNAWFDLFTISGQVESHTIAGTPLLTAQVNQKQIIYLDWQHLHNRPLLKDDFAQCFRQSRADFVLLDHVPFFADIAPEDVGLTFLGNLFRFVNFVDAIHDCNLPLLVRGTHTEQLDTLTAGHHLRPILAAYDKRTGSQQGSVAWIEWSRCLSRLRSRQALNIPLTTIDPLKTE